jgi:hypothetical protein
MVDSLDVWNDCVQVAKGATGENSYQIIRGNVLKRAQKAYLTIMLGNKKFQNAK